MIRIATTDLREGDVIRASNYAGTVTWVPTHFGSRFSVGVDHNIRHMTSAGSVELLSDLGDREACKSFGRW
jgi:hypothetical protein